MKVIPIPIPVPVSTFDNVFEAYTLLRLIEGEIPKPMREMLPEKEQNILNKIGEVRFRLETFLREVNTIVEGL